MDHRYGRHGPHAWLRQRMHRYACTSLLPIPVDSPPVVPTTTICVFVPATTERIIFIIMSNTANSEDDGAYLETNLSIVPLPSNMDEIRKMPESPMERMARNQARKDAKGIRGLTADGNFVRISWDKVYRETDAFAEKALETIYPGLKMPDDYECERLIKEYQEAYHQSLKERLSDASVDYFDTGRESRLRDLAIADRENAPQPQQRPYHQRDLAVIRVLMLLEVSLDIDDDYLNSHLADIHTWADKYEHYYRNPRKEKNWPECRVPF